MTLFEIAKTLIDNISEHLPVYLILSFILHGVIIFSIFKGKNVQEFESVARRLIALIMVSVIPMSLVIAALFFHRSFISLIDLLLLVILFCVNDLIFTGTILIAAKLAPRYYRNWYSS